MFKIGKSIETEKKLVVGQGLEEGNNGAWLLNKFKVAFWCDKNVLERNSGDESPILWMY